MQHKIALCRINNGALIIILYYYVYEVPVMNPTGYKSKRKVARAIEKSCLPDIHREQSTSAVY